MRESEAASKRIQDYLVKVFIKVGPQAYWQVTGEMPGLFENVAASYDKAVIVMNALSRGVPFCLGVDVQGKGCLYVDKASGAIEQDWDRVVRMSSLIPLDLLADYWLEIGVVDDWEGAVEIFRQYGLIE